MCWWNDITVHLQEMVLGENWWYASNFQITKSFTGKLSKMIEIEMWPTFMTPQESFNPRTTYQDAFINKEFGEIKKYFSWNTPYFNAVVILNSLMNRNYKKFKDHLHNFFNKSNVMYINCQPKCFCIQQARKLKIAMVISIFSNTFFIKWSVG